MYERISACLDGDLSRADLSPLERVELDRLEALLDEVAAHLRTRPMPDLTDAVMSRIDRLSPRSTSLWAWLGAWLWTPRTLQLRWRPAYAVGAMAALALLLMPRPAEPPGARPAPIVAAAPEAATAGPADARGNTAPVDTPVYVQFRLEAAGASRVALAGNFTGWEPRYELQETAPGSWSIVLPLRPGVHDYAFVVDGRHWVADPYAPRVDDGFGGANSRIALLPPDAGRRL
jgi:hypothetical protein